MLRIPRRRAGQKGFTLVELAIVVAIAGLLFAGLWRLMSSGTQQLAEQAAADQMQKLANAVKGYLSSSNGQQWLATASWQNNLATGTFNLPLPAAGAPAGSTNCKTTAPMSTASAPSASSLWRDFCDYLPSGFSAASINPYGQAYEIKVRRVSGTLGSAPTAYEFMILTNDAGGTNVIPDTQGGRIAALMGGDGGFVYTNNNVCGSPPVQWACGAFGGFAININSYSSASSFTASSSGGRIASRTFVSADSSTSSPWLARSLLPGDNATTPVFNTMSTSLVLGGQQVYMGANTTATTGGGNFNVAGGDITGQGRIVLGATAGKTGVANFNNTGGTGAAVVITGTGSGDAATVNSGDLTVSAAVNANAFVYTSDRNLKHDIVRLDGTLDKLLQIEGVSFRWNSDDSESMGLIAQDVEKVYPELVVIKADGTKGVDYGKLVGPIIESIRALHEENAALRHEIERLKR
ncbi:MAG: prepilin-type N-terminal cleavage/methylation domain-containing protein [Alphaproteobacteria bacterium]|nr:prepilin-type N-terminal cleavage/methylation domain-containing protein [Alphaproteobacteria bacterium]